MITAEQAVIGALLLDGRWLKDAVAYADPDDFEDGRLGDLYRQMILLPSAGVRIDVISVGDRLKAWGIRGIDLDDLHGWTSEVPYAAAVGEYARQVHDAAMRRRLRVIGAQLGNRADEPGTAIARAIRDLQALQQLGRSGLSARPLGERLASVSTEYDWLVPGLLERRDRLMLTGSEGLGKSMLLRQLAVLPAAGLHPFTGFPITPVRVLYIDAENSDRQWKRQTADLLPRARQLGSADPAESLILECTPRLNLLRDRDLGWLHRQADDHRPDMVILGPLYRLTPGAVNDDTEAAPFLAALDTLRDRGMALLLEAHSGHALDPGSTSRGLRPRGSSALLGWPEFGLGLRAIRDGGGQFELVRWRGDRDAREWPRALVRGQRHEWPWMPSVRL